MADAQANINVNIDSTQALAQLKMLQRGISDAYSKMASGGAAANANLANLSQNLVNGINATGKFSASITKVSSGTEYFTNALEKNKLSMREYFRFAAGSTKTFGKVFTGEFNTIEKVARERVKSLQTQYIKMGRDANGAIQAIKVRPLALDMNNLSTQVMMASQKQQIFNQLLKQGTTNLLNFGKNTQWAGRQLMVGFTVPLTIMGGIAIREFQKIEEQVVKFKRVYGTMFTTDAQTEKALDDVKKLANEFTKYGIAIEKTIDLAAKVAQMGNMGAALEAQVTQATRLSVLGGMEQQEALDTTISLTNAFGISIEELGQKINFLNAAENQTILAIEDFNTAIPLAGSVVQQLGGDVEDLAFFLTAMREGGINASQAGNALKSSLGRLIAPSRNAKETLAGFGIDVVNVVEQNAGNLKQTIMVLAQELDKLDPLSRARSIEALFGKFQFARMSTLFQNITKEGSQANKVLDLTGKSTQELAILAERELKRVEDSPLFKFQKQVEQLQASLAPLGQEFLKLVTPLIDFATKAINWFNNLGDGAKQMGLIIVAALGVIAPTFLMTFGLMANGLANLIKAFSKVGAFFDFLAGKSKIAGNDTNYLNSEMIESQAIASSLEQSHQRLQQVFSSESASVQQLAAAYERAAIAAGAFGRNRVGMPASSGAAGNYDPFMPPKKYADGVVMVPGPKGAGDVVPAMLSPGEAVIPAEQTQKYLPLIRGMIADNIPGFNGGTDGQNDVALVSSGSRTVGQTLALEMSGAPELNAKLENLAKTLDNLIARIDRIEGPGAGEKAVRASISKDEGASLKGVKTEGGLKATEEYKNVLYPRSMKRQEKLHMDAGVSARAEDLKGKTGGAAGRLIDNWATVNPDKEIKLKTAFTRRGSAEANRALQTGMPVSEAIDDYEKFGKSKWDDVVSFGTDENTSSEDMKKIKDGFSAYDRKMLELQQAIRDDVNSKVEYFIDSEADIDKIVAKARESAQSSGEKFDGKAEEALRAKYKSYESLDQEASSVLTPEAQAVRQKALGTAIEARVPVTNEEKEELLRLASGQNLKEGEQQKVAAAQSLVNEYGLDPLNDKQEKKNVSQKIKGDGLDLSDIEAQTESEMRSLGEGAGGAVVDGTADSLESNSPSRRMFKLGKGAGDALANGFEESRSGEKQISSNPLAPPPPPEADASAFKPSIGQKAKDIFSDSKIGQGIGKKLAKLSGNALTDSKGNITYDPNEDMSTWAGKMTAEQEALKNSYKETAEAARQAATSVDDHTDSLQQNDVAASSASSQEPMVMGPNGELITQQSAEKIAKDDIKRQRRAKAGKIGFGAMAVANMGIGMATQREDKIGEVARAVMPLTMALNMLPMLFSALGGPITLVVAALGLLAFGIYKYIETMNKARTAGIELADSMSSTSKKMKEISEFTGTVSATELREANQRRLMTGLDPVVDPKFGESFLDAAPGQQMLSDIEKMQEAGMSIQQIGTSLAASLSNAMVQGVLTPEQARSIVAQLGLRLQDFAVPMQVTAEITRFTGPNGSDLRDNPIEVAVRVQEASLQQFEDIVESLDAPRRTGRGGRRGQKTQREQKQIGGQIVNLGIQGLGVSQQQLDVIDKTANEQRAQLEQSLALAQSEQTRQYILEDIERLENRAAIAKQKAFDSNKKILDSLISQREELGNSEFNTIIGEVVQARYADTGFERLAKEASDKLAAFGSTDEEIQFRVGLQASFAQGDIDFSTVNLLVKAAESNQDLVAQYNMSVRTMGAADTNMLIQLLGQADAAPESYTYYFQMINSNPDSVDEILEALSVLNSVNANYEFSIDVDGQKGLDNVATLTKAVEDLESLGETFTKPELEVLAEEGNETARRFLESWDEILEGRSTATKSLVYTFEGIMLGDQQVLDWYETNILAGKDEDEVDLFKNFSRSVQITIATEEYVRRVGPITTFNETEGDAEIERPQRDRRSSGGGGGGGNPSSALDGLIKQLRDLRMAQIDVTNGWVESRNTLDKLFGSGSFTGFAGLEQQMRALGAGEDLISLIAGMPPEEFERRKNELFIFDKDGNIVKATNALKNMGKALSAIALGKFQNEQEKTLASVNNQIVAVRKLTAAGLSLAQAYEAVKDAAFAAAIAQEKNTDVIRETVALLGEATEASKAFAAASAVAARNEQAANMNDVLGFIETNRPSLTQSQIQAILNDPDLQRLVLDPSIDPETLRTALNNAANQAQLDLRIKKLTFEGLNEIFNEGFSKAMEAFAAKEQQIKLTFEVLKEPYLEAIKKAEQEIADIRNRAGGLDDLQADLQRISWQEEDINEKYDERFKALQRIEEMNGQLSQQQKDQLDVADALTRGDIAGAARAMRQQQANQRQQSIQLQRKTLELNKEKELAELVGNMGLTRKELDQAIKALNMEILEIEENRLEPAQRAVDLLEIQEQNLIDSLTVLGKTKKEWEKVRNEVDLAVVSSDAFQQSMKNALEVVEDILTYWDKFDDKAVDLFVDVKQRMPEIPEMEGVEGPGPAPETGGGGGGLEKDYYTALQFSELAEYLKLQFDALGEIEINVFGDTNLVDELEQSANKINEIKGFLNDVGTDGPTAIAGIAESLSHLDKDSRALVLEGLEGSIAKMAREAPQTFALISKSLAKLPEDVQRDVAPYMDKLFEQMGESGSARLEKVKNFATEMKEKINDEIPGAKYALDKFYDDMSKNGVVSLQSLTKAFMNMPKDVRDKTAPQFQAMFRDLATDGTDALSVLGTFMSDELSPEMQAYLGPHLYAAIQTFVDEGVLKMDDLLAAAEYLGIDMREMMDIEVFRDLDEEVEAIRQTFRDQEPFEIKGKVTGIDEDGGKQHAAEYGAGAGTIQVPGEVTGIDEDGGKQHAAEYGAGAGTIQIPSRVEPPDPSTATGVGQIAGSQFVEGFDAVIRNLDIDLENIKASFISAGAFSGAGFAREFKTEVASIVPESETLTTFFSDLGSPAGESFKKNFEGIINTVSADNTAIKTNFENLGTNSGNAFKTKFLEIVNVITAANTTLKSYFESLGGPSGTAFTTKFLEILNVITVANTTIKIYFESLGESSGTGFATKFLAILNVIAVANTTIKSYFETLGTDSANAFKTKFLDIVEKMKPEIKVKVTYEETNSPPTSKTIKDNDGGYIKKNNGGMLGYNIGGSTSMFPGGGSVPGFGNYDNVPALLTPGEFVIRREAVKKYGQNFFEQLNSTIYSKPDFQLPSFDSAPMSRSDVIGKVQENNSGSVYNNNYDVYVNVKSESNPEEIAKTVIKQIRRAEDRKIRGNRI
jgi:TP901 family phage tail tape measure protein